MNVACTRARHQLLCVGNAHALANLLSAGSSQTLCLLAKDALARNVIHHQMDYSTDTAEERKHPRSKADPSTASAQQEQEVTDEFNNNNNKKEQAKPIRTGPASGGGETRQSNEEVLRICNPPRIKAEPT